MISLTIILTDYRGSKQTMEIQTLITTLMHRPYVFVFLVSFLVIGVLNRGFARTFLFLLIGFWIAYLSEISSIRNGFPYGMYHYLYENMRGETVIGGVPVWDSLSYSFLAYASYELTSFFIGHSRYFLMVASLMMVLLDVVVDPLAVRGDRWFLGKIFYYPSGGLYFGVPLSNFMGWFLVAFAILYSYHFLEKKIFARQPPLRAHFLGPLFYWGILAFNLTITFWMGEIFLGGVGLGLHLLVGGILYQVRSSFCSLPSYEKTLGEPSDIVSR